MYASYSCDCYNQVKLRQAAMNLTRSLALRSMFTNGFTAVVQFHCRPVQMSRAEHWY